MDDFSLSSLEPLLHQKIKVETNGSFFVGLLVSINNRELTIKGRRYRKNTLEKVEEIKIPIDSIDAIMIPSHSKNVNY